MSPDSAPSVFGRARADAWPGFGSLGLLLLVLALLLAGAPAAQAETKFCSSYPDGVIDGDVLGTVPGQITIDTDCTFKNWPESNPWDSTINYQTNDESIYLIVFDNFWLEGHLACSNIPHRLWVVNSPENAFSGTCQDVMIPAETIQKQSPAPTAGIGVPFTYTLTLPSMNYPAGDPSPNNLHSVVIEDDLAATGADLTYVSHSVSGLPAGVTYSFSDGGGKFLTFDFGDSVIEAGTQITFDITVVLDDTPTNVAGTQFVNTAKWWFGRLIKNEQNPDDPGEFYDPLPGESGIAAPMTIVEPGLEVTKTSDATALNLDDVATFTIDVLNTGGDAWEVTILDQLPLPVTFPGTPSDTYAGMCEHDPSVGLSARIVEADGATLVRELDPSTYTVAYTGDNGGPDACRLSFSMSGDAGPIGHNQRLLITYQSQLDQNPLTNQDGVALTNVAGATQWFSADGGESHPRRIYEEALSDGSGIHEDSYTVYTALSGYYFQKTVTNLTTGVYPAHSAVPGDKLRYRLRLFNVDQVINQLTISDTLDLAYFDPNSFAMVSLGGAEYVFNGATGELAIFHENPKDLNVGNELVIEFDITLKSPLNDGVAWNQASFTAVNSEGQEFQALSDDPYINGVAPPNDPDNPPDPTEVAIQTPGGLSKEITQDTATIGEHFTYRIKVPAVPTAVPLYNVRILDDLSLSAADLRFVSAEVVEGGSWSLSNAGTDTDLIIEDSVNGINIPPNGQAVIDITLELLNTSENIRALEFSNSARYTYNRAYGVDVEVDGGEGSSGPMTVVEPAVTAATKSVRFVAPADKVPTDPATVGDVLEYAITIPNSGDSTAFDTNVVDSLPAEVSLVAGSATAQINGVDVTGFVVDPTTLGSGALVWGEQNGDNSLSIPPGQSLVLSYQVTVESANGTDINNSVYVDWTSLDGGSLAERTGDGCPITTAPDNYCFGPVAAAPISTLDNTSIAKAVVDDTYVEEPASAAEPVVRVGDTVTYELTLNLQEYTTSNVVIEDVLPAGMVYDGLVSITPASGSDSFTYSVLSQPATGDAVLTWDLGDIVNAPSNDGTPIDQLVIRYAAKVLTDAPTVGVGYETSIFSDNQATLSYTGGDPATYPDRLTATATLEVRQPQMSAISKLDLGAGRVGTGTETDPYQVDIATDVMNFQLSSCNDGLAPAYGVEITDLLAPELDETDLTANAPVVKVGTSTLTQGSDYTYSAPARGGEMQIALLESAPVNPNECVTVDYEIGFHTDLASQTIWNNQAELRAYWSLPVDGRPYTPTDTAQVWMTNLVGAVQPLSKTLASPAEATVGEQVEYTISVPGQPVNAAFDDVVVTDLLHGALEYVGADAVDLNGNLVDLTDSSIAPNQVELGISHIPAGQQVIITLTARVANNDQANAGASVINTASYTYTGIPDGSDTSDTSGPLTIVEPTLAIDKTVANVSNPDGAPNAGDILRYSVSFTASGGVQGDDFSDAFDLLIEDTLGLGLVYQSNTATVDGTGNTIAEPGTNGGDGVNTAQVLTWSLADATADIDVVEGTVVTVTYDVLVLDSVLAGQALTNSATVQWTGLDDPSALERDGSGGLNDYFTGPASAPPLTVLDNTTIAKTRLTDTWAGADVRIGDVIDYELRLHLDEGSHSGLTLSDVLPHGLQFEQVVSINGDSAAPYSAVAPFSHADIAAPSVTGDAAIGPTTVTWSLGDVVNLADNDAGNDEFVIVYRARVLNNDVFAQVNSTTLTNTATLNYTTASGTASQSDSDSLILLQPDLTVSKSAAPAGGDTFIDAGETISYTVEVTNTGAAPAYDVVVQDILPAGLRQGGVTTTSISLVTAGTTLTTLAPIYDAGTGTATWDFDNAAADYTIPAGETLRIVYTVQADANLGAGLTLGNAVTATDYYSFDDEQVPSAGTVTGEREHYGPSNTDRTTLTTPLPGGPLKENPADPTATIGQEFTYTITVPQTPLPTALHDVRILDNIDALVADVTLVSVDKISGTQPWTPVNTGTASDLIIEDTTGGIEIPANEQIVIGVTLRLDNTGTNNAGVTFTNSASYTYNQVDGDDASWLDGGSSSTTAMSVVEPSLTVSKTATPLSTPITGGTIIEYAVTVSNTGDSTAHDVNVADTLPPELALHAGFTPTATIDGTPVDTFVPAPAGAPDGPLVWGRNNGDGSLDVPVNGQLVITYQAQVQVSTAATVDNEVWVDWTSLEGDSSYERTGAGCPTITAPNDYCVGPATATVTITDTNSLSKSVLTDSYVDEPSTATDATVRIGDTVTYRLELQLGEGTTAAVSVSDELPPGMAFDSLLAITPSPGGNFSYSGPTGPTTGDTGTLVWDFGDIVNAPSNDGTLVDTLSIEYTATVLPDAGIAHVPSTTLTNTATLSYVDGSGTPVIDPARLEAQASLTLWQPVMDSLSKTDRLGRTGTSATPLNVNVASDTMQFRLQSCNTTGLAPAYGVVLTDVLASELDETSLTTPVVSVGGTVLGAGDYTYTPPAGRGGTLSIQLSTPVEAGQCVTADYEIGFHTDFGPNRIWNNSVTLDEYWSLPLQAGQLYGLVGAAEFWMTNQATIDPPTKALTSAAEATIGEEVTYQITVPATPANAALYDVVVSDTLHGSLAYLSATEISGNGLSLTDNTDNSVLPTEVNLVIDRIPAGEQAVIEVTARVANNESADAGTSFENTVSYTYAITDGGAANPGGSFTTTGPLTLVEPAVAIGKTVDNVSNPGAAPNPGDILRYSVTFTAAGGAAGDAFSDAFDLLIEDSLSLGLAYQSGTAGVDGTGNTIADPAITGDGSTTEQTLTWRLADATADIDVVEGSTVTVTYDVLVLDGVPAGQELSNSATVQWTGHDGDHGFERDGTGTPAVNDYFAGPATSTLTTELAVSFVKSVVNATTGENPGANAKPGETLRYTLVVTNESIIPLNNASIVDELAAQFAPGTLQVLSVSDPNADTTNTSSTGGVNGTGIVDIRNLTLAVGETLTIEFQATLAAVIDSGTTVLNRAQLSGDHLASATSNETATLIASAPALEVWKTSLDISDDPSHLRAGDTLRYTLTVKNVGTEDAVNAILVDQLPTNTTYVPNSTTLNGAPIADQSPGVLPLQEGVAIYAPEDPTPGAMRADASETGSNIATITFDVVIDADVFNGTEISNQGFVSADGVGSGPMPLEPSDDPGTDAIDDPTRDVVGNVPLIDAHKTVELQVDGSSPGIVDPGDVLRYTIVVTNTGVRPATDVVLIDAVPADTAYVPGSVMLNGLPVADPAGGGSPLASGIPISSSDLTPPLPGAGEGTLSVDGSATVTFDVQVNAGVAADTVISNQGRVESNEQLDELTDADGIDSNGDQPTEVIVGEAQQLSITKEVFVDGGGAAVPGATLQYVIRATNIGSVPATNVVITDALPGQLTYVPDSGTLDGLRTGVSFAAPVITADYSATYGSLEPGATTVLRFRAQIDPATAIGETVTNLAEVSWDAGQTASAEVSIDIGGTPGAVSLNGQVWHDANFNTIADGSERLLADWSVDVYRNNQLLGSVATNADGVYRIQGLAANDASTAYEIRFRAPGAGAATALLGEAHSSYTNALQRISDITAGSGTNVQNLNLPITPNGVVYDSVLRTPVAGAAVTMLRAGVELPASCFDDPAQQNQITSPQGYYKFDINFGDPACLAGGDYSLRVTPPATGYTDWPSRIIPPTSDESTAAFSVPACLGGADDAISATPDRCEVQTSEFAPAANVAARSAGTTHHLHLRLDDNQIPGESQAFNNHLPVDPELDTAIAITKTSALINVSRGQHVPYTITLRNTLGTTLQDLSIVDAFPAGFKYVKGSGRLNGQAVEPDVNGLQLSWNNLELGAESQHTLQMLFIVGAGVSEGEHVNRARAINTLTGESASGEASATVRVVPDPTFDCTDITGKVFDDANLDGVQDANEKGLGGVRLATARGLIVETDEYGRFHLTCAVTPNETRGSNFILKLDDRTLPTGYRMSTENPRVQRATRGKMMRFNFGATLHRVVRIDVADGVFEADSTEMRVQWKPRVELLIEELRKSPSVVRIAYLADVEEQSLVKRRLNTLREEITGKWEALNCCYPLTVETETFWRRGAPPER